MMIVLIFVIGVIVYRSLIMEPLYELAQDKYSWGAKYTPTVAVATGALIQVLLIQFSGAVSSSFSFVTPEASKVEKPGCHYIVGKIKITT